MYELRRIRRLGTRVGSRCSRSLLPHRRLLWSLCLTLQFAIALPWAAATESLTEPQRVIQRVSDGLMRVLREDRHLLENDPAYVYRLVDDLFLPNVDFERVSSLVLGPYWRRASVEQREAFSHEFKNLLIHTYATAVNELSVWEIRYLPQRLEPEQKEVTVRTQVMRPGGEPIDVNYRMVYKEKRWLAYDVAVAGISLLTNYRSTFIRLVRQKGIDGLIAELAARNATRHGQPQTSQRIPIGCALPRV
ncbi:MAG: ABC transporter substrate-binding protein [Pseudomonadota bacterium]|nr:ABC transporter substrate-binding protein [Pseudomonadota bacterium]